MAGRRDRVFWNAAWSDVSVQRECGGGRMSHRDRVGGDTAGRSEPIERPDATQASGKKR